ncbi:MAG TPA: acetyl-CoA carboxylase biotin carboxyl carrier protein subunit [Methanofastidiosum sp.]|jgi:biotin carboxyl carrier protein|nr:acetyl-CoA carboxylase biotin carboxyl carrier protein subunit [Methanofastidiosum sp.]HOG74247.1 acetyl-CoA carboxylase biotin carboxyl carrier protein subunit [Methanofastidiosum sp.]HRZ19449.1 acetyl-CoA carboxylase biotin carboxyl carrier protein subunit [Methanofastidiosum sp.]
MAKYKVNVDGKDYEVEVENTGSGNLEVKLGNKKSTVSIEELLGSGRPQASSKPAYQAPSNRPAPQAAPVSKPPSGKGEPIKAVMAGTVLSLKKQPGDKVSVGDVVLILEAMKMENEISSPSNGTIVDILVSPGKAINTGDTLFTIG